MLSLMIKLKILETKSSMVESYFKKLQQHLILLCSKTYQGHCNSQGSPEKQIEQTYTSYIIIKYIWLIIHNKYIASSYIIYFKELDHTSERMANLKSESPPTLLLLPLIIDVNHICKIFYSKSMWMFDQITRHIT